MEKAVWKVTLADGTTIDGLTLNGNNFVSPKSVTADIFAGKLSHVTIEGPEGADTLTGTGDAGLRGEHGAMTLARCQKDDLLGGYAFVLVDVSEADMEKLRNRGDIEYIAMMTGVEL